MDHYSTLGVNKDAAPEDIKRAYRKLASKHHPDKGGDTAEFQRVEEAYRILSDPEQRAAYDNPAPSGFNFNFNQNGQDINLDDIFGRFGFGNPFQHHPNFKQQRRNKDIKADIQVLLIETIAPQTKTLRIKTSNDQVQTVDITIPQGITSGTTIKYPGLGDNMFQNLPRGDLYINVTVVNNTQFEVQGLDLTTQLTINCFEAIIGTEQTIVGLDGKQFVISTPKGCQPDTRLKITGEGLPAFQKDIKGNLYVRVKVTIPRNLSEQQIEQIKQITTNQ
mgnify:CR=1 FL=1